MPQNRKISHKSPHTQILTTIAHIATIFEISRGTMLIYSQNQGKTKYFFCPVFLVVQKQVKYLPGYLIKKGFKKQIISKL